MSLNFPNSPSTNDTHVTGGSTWIFNGEMWVRQGTRGAQGLQGLQGNQGVQGLQGLSNQGVQGNQGLQGRQGTQGLTGAFGGATFTYGFLTNTANTDPGTGKVKFNNSNLSSATTLFIDDEDDNGTDIQSYLRTIDDSTSGIKGHFKVADLANPDDFALFTITASSTEQSGYFSIPVSYVSGSATSFSNGENLTVTFARTGDKGDTGIQGLQGLQGNQGVQGLSNQGVQGLQGLQGLQGNQGVQGAQGLQGNQGTQGLQGLQGNQGVQGLQGTQGNQGTQGLQGNQGTQGLQGNQGVQGLSNQGTQGLQGLQGIHSRVAISTESPSPADVGDFWYDSDDSALFIYYDSNNDGTGDQWIEIGAGPTGAQGTQGTQGLQGHQGLQGNQGVQGTQGLQGNQGTQGLQGLQGNQGVQGTQGLQGLQGNQGTQGTQGLQGTQGTQGLQGNQGVQGLQGLQGNQGVQGTQGTQGTQGLQGTQGNQGTQGTQGLQGVQGTQGTQGLQGLSGSDSYGINYTFDSSTSESDPGSGEFRFSINWLNGSLGNAYNAYVSEADSDGVGIAGLLDTLDDSSSTNKALIVLYKKNTMTVNAKFYVTGMTDNGGWRTLDIEYIDRDGWVNISNGDDVFMSISIIGDRGSQGLQGVQGVQGNQGLQGVQGNQGLQGLQGNQGVQGLQGMSNQGVQGTQGLQGRQGTQGLTGAFGGATFSYDFNTSTSGSDPGAGKLAVNNSNLTAATLLLLDDVDENGTDIQTFLRTIDDSTSTLKGHVKVSSSVQPDDFVLYTISSTSELSGHHRVDVSYVSGSVTSFSNGQDLVATFARTGDKGDTGNQGTQGLSNQGVQGLQGLQGIHSRVAISTESPSPADVGDFWYDNDDSALFIYYDSNQDGTGDQWIEIGAGPTGAQGLQGTQATQGVQGTQGLQGLQGNQGTQGLQGNQGVQGLQGLQGNQGVQGVQGTQGVQGLQGLQGNQGTQGAQGTQGRQGLQGLQGNQGTQGTQGRQGTQGTQGVQGRDGQNAGQGTQGVQGLAGTSAGGSNGVDYNDDVKVRFGTGNDLEIYHNGSDSYIDDAGTGVLFIRSNDLRLGKYTGELGAQIIADGETRLHFNNSVKLQTKTGGIDVTGEVQCDSLDVDGAADITGNVTLHANLDLQDDDTILIGTGDDLQITHNGNASYISNYTGTLFIDQEANDGTIALRSDNGSGSYIEYLECVGSSGEVRLHHYGNQKLATKSTGIDITGDVTITDTATNSSAGPELKLYRNSSSPDDGDYLGQIKFQGESDTGATRNYAKITGKIGDASNGTEDGILEFAFLKAGSQNINARWTSTELMLLNDTHLSLQDSQEIRLGASDDLQLWHNGSQSYISNITGTLNIRTTSSAGGDINLNSNDNVSIKVQGGNETAATFTQNGSVDLYYDNSKKFETTSNGVKITGGLQDGDGDLGSSGQVLSSTGTALNWVDADSGPQGVQGLKGNNGSSGSNGAQGIAGSDGSSGSNGAQGTQGSAGSNGSSGSNGAQGTQGEQGPAGGSTGTDYNDNVKVRFGNSNDLQIYHDASNSRIDNSTGHLVIKNTADDHDIVLSTDNGSGGNVTYVSCDGSTGSVRLNHYGTEKAYTKSDGFDVVGELQCDSLDVDGAGNISGILNLGNNLDMPDSAKIILGNGDDLQIYHDGTHSYIKEGGTGNLKVLTTSMVVKNAADNETMLQATQNGSVDLYYNNSKTFKTVSGGAQITGDNGLFIKSSTNSVGAKIKFSSFVNGNYSQVGTIEYLHGDGDVTTTGGNSNDGWIVSGTETRTVFKVEGDIEATSNVYASSDISLKDNIVTYENALDKVLALRGVEYDRNDLDGVHEVGLIAQEVEEIIPELVGESRDGLKNIAYGKLTAVLVEAVKELKKENDALSARIQSLEDR